MSGGNNLDVDPDAVQRGGTAFSQAGGEFGALNADAALGDAAGVGSQLATAGACRKAQSTITAQTKALATETDQYGGKLKSAAAEYRSTDHASGAAIKNVKFGT